MKKYLLISGVIIIGLLTYLVIHYIPIIQEGQKLNELRELQAKRYECEQLQKNSHLDAENIRKSLGLTLEAQSPQRTGTEAELLVSQPIE